MQIVKVNAIRHGDGRQTHGLRFYLRILVRGQTSNDCRSFYKSKLNNKLVIMIRRRRSVTPRPRRPCVLRNMHIITIQYSLLRVHRQASGRQSSENTRLFLNTSVHTVPEVPSDTPHLKYT